MSQAITLNRAIFSIILFVMDDDLVNYANVASRYKSCIAYPDGKLVEVFDLYTISQDVHKPSSNLGTCYKGIRYIPDLSVMRWDPDIKLLTEVGERYKKLVSFFSGLWLHVDEPYELVRVLPMGLAREVRNSLYPEGSLREQHPVTEPEAGTMLFKLAQSEVLQKELDLYMAKKFL